ncbi:hypothetical protein [Candidatus Endomicrobiellum trichonymphae]|nr:hypothetical protein [Candidatus Endomicrobium trichonymphae]
MLSVFLSGCHRKVITGISKNENDVPTSTNTPAPEPTSTPMPTSTPAFMDCFPKYKAPSSTPAPLDADDYYDNWTKCVLLYVDDDGNWVNGKHKHSEAHKRLLLKDL